MPRHVVPCLAFSLPLLLTACKTSGGYQPLKVEHPAVASVERYTVTIPRDQMLPYTGVFSAGFADGLPLAPGSGLAFRKMEADGSLLFWGLGDRGPNGDSPKVAASGGKAQASKVFMAPGFVPRFVEVRVQPGKSATLGRAVPLMQKKQTLSGLPLPAGAVGASGEVPLSDTLKTLPFDDQGVDPEGIAQDRVGNLWLVDEYGPFLMKVSQDGQVLERLAPGKGLPANLAARQPNRGFEGVAITPSGKVYAAVQSTLDVDGKTKHLAQFIRIVEYDPASGATRQFAYPIDVDAYKRPGDAKIGDLLALDDTRFLLLDQGSGKNGMRNVVYVIDIAGATDIGTMKTPAGQELEYAKPAELAGVKMIRKQRVLDLREIGWNMEKAEGLALAGNRIAVINDNDFGLKASIAGNKGTDLDDYSVTDGQVSDAGRYAVQPNGEHTELWLLELRQPLSAYFPK